MAGSKRLGVLGLVGALLLLGLLARPLKVYAASTVAVGPGEGVTLQQVDYNWDTSPDVDSTTGELDVDIPTLTSATGITSGFLNVGTSLGWVVQNLPVDATDDPYAEITTQFDLSQTDGSAVTTESADVEFSSSPVTSFSTGSTQMFSVGDVGYDGSGKGATAVSGTETAPAPGVVSFVGGPAFTFCFQANHPNIEAADNQCGPASVANSLTWLKTTYGLAIPDNNVQGLCDTTSLVGKLDTLMNRCAGPPTRRAGPTVRDNAFLTGKLQYLANNNLGSKVVVKHQARNDEGVGGGDFMAAGLTSHGNGAAPTSSFILSEVCAGEDVELGFIYARGGGHWVEITGAGSILGVPWITYVSDHDQTNDANGTGKVDFSFLKDTDADGLLNLVNEGGSPNAQIVVTESPASPQSAVPEAQFAAPFLLVGGGAFLALYRRRRRSAPV